MQNYNYILIIILFLPFISQTQSPYRIPVRTYPPYTKYPYPTIYVPHPTSPPVPTPPVATPIYQPNFICNDVRVNWAGNIISFNLESLAKILFSVFSEGYSYSFQLCRNIDCGFFKSGICQSWGSSPYEKISTGNYPLNISTVAYPIIQGYGGISFNLTGGTDGRKSKIMVLCDHNARYSLNFC